VDLPLTLAEFFERVPDLVQHPAWQFYVGGAGDEITLTENASSWRRIGLRQRVLVDVSVRDISVRLLGGERPTPFVIAPMAYQAVLHAGAEPEAARGATLGGASYILSTLATTGIAQLAAEAPDTERWFQLYVLRDRSVTHAMLDEAADSGYTAIVVTADLPVLGVRDRDRRSGFAVPDIGTVPNAAATGLSGEMTPGQFAALIDPSLTWDDLADLVERSPLPVLVKGILDPDDARRAVEAGVAGIIVSNHGGRQLDTVQATATALPRVAAAVRESGRAVDVLVDGGIRRGTDVLKALALGADAVSIGRPAAAGLAVGGAAGVQRVLQILTEELMVGLALVGVPRARDLDSSVLAG
jgi:4-hydroxymandelate oxidase